MLEARVIRDWLRGGVTAKWVHSVAQMTDSLPKDMDASTLRAFLSRGRCVHHDIDEILRQRSDKKLRSEWCLHVKRPSLAITASSSLQVKNF